MSKVSLDNVIRKTVGGGTPDRGNAEFWDGEIPWATVKDFKDANYKIAATKESISEKGLKLSASNLVPAGTPVICTRMAVGRIARPSLPVAINQDLRALFIHDDFDTDYVVWAIDSIRNRIENLSIGSTVKGINVDQLLSFEIFSTPKPEQTKIAEVLSTVDRAIEQTEALIAKQQRIKTGLMQDLLTRGIDEHGNLRSEETHEFKDSPLGRIPAEWNVIKLSDVTTVKNGTTPSRGVSSYWTGGTIPWLSTGKVHDRLIYSADEHITDMALRLFSLDLLPKGTVLVAMIGQGLTRGKAAYLEISACINQNFAAILPCPDLNSKFLFHYLELNYEHVRGSGRGSNQMALNCSIVAGLETVAPSLPEQHRIAEILDVQDARIRAEEAYRDKLKLQKTALMQDLLTGEKRVTPLLEAEAAHNAGSAS